MCGINGILQFDGPARPEIVQRMTDCLAHRGPDGGGLHVQDRLGLGHRRLAIIDPAGGVQPLSNPQQDLWITYNGELYNYLDLRQQLSAKGYTFRTHSDTETVLYAYQEWGPQCVERFRGMFAFAIGDFKAGRLFLARDPLGIKPLYYIHQANRFAFASEIQALRALPDFPVELNLPAIDQYLWLQYIPAPQTVFEQVFKLPPAHRMMVDFAGRTNGPEAYWQLEFRPNLARSQAEWIEALDEALRASVRAHLVSDVPFGAFLSGGVDSSAVVAYMAQILNRPVQTFTIGFEQAAYDESAYAQQAAQRWGTEHHLEIVRPDALEILPDLARHYGEPFGDSSAIPTYYVSRMARQYAPMVLSGDGGDEAFAGYQSYLGWMEWLAHDDLRRKPLWKRAAYPLARKLLPQRYPDPQNRRPSLANWLRFIEYLGRGQRSALWRPEYRRLVQDQNPVFDRAYAQAQGYPPASLAQYLDLHTYLPFDILTKVDVASMMHGLEVRTPIVDVRVIELAAAIPQDLSIGRGPGGSWEGKRLLKQVLQRYYPAEFLNRPKMGFAVPIQDWLGGDGRGAALRQRLLGPESSLQAWFDPAAIASLIERGQARGLWLLLFLEEWLRQNQAARRDA